MNLTITWDVCHDLELHCATVIAQALGHTAYLVIL